MNGYFSGSLLDLRNNIYIYIYIYIYLYIYIKPLLEQTLHLIFYFEIHHIKIILQPSTQ